MAQRYAVTPRQWERLKDWWPGKVSDRGRPAGATRQFVTGVRWVLRSGARWCDLPERSGNWQRIQKRFPRWARAGVWERVFAHLTADRHTASLMLDGPLVRAPQQAATGTGGTQLRLWDGPAGDERRSFLWRSILGGGPYALS